MEGIRPLSSFSLSLFTFTTVPLILYIPIASIPYFSMASQHFTTIVGTSTSSRAICSPRSTPKVGRPLSTPFGPWWVACTRSRWEGNGGNYRT